MKNGDQPAYPIQYEQEYGDHGMKEQTIKGGMTKREVMAMAAMQGFLSILGDTNIGEPKPDYLASMSVKYADALLAELEKVYDSEKGNV